MPTSKKKSVRPAIIASRFNQPIVEKLVSGAIRGFVQNGIQEKAIDIFWVPGAFELPLAAKKIAKSKKYDCAVCVGCVIKGETFHFDYVAQAAASGISAITLETKIPISFSVILTESPQKAWERAGDDSTNRGYEGALTALEMLAFMKK